MLTKVPYIYRYCVGSIVWVFKKKLHAVYLQSSDSMIYYFYLGNTGSLNQMIVSGRVGLTVGMSRWLSSLNWSKPTCDQVRGNLVPHLISTVLSRNNELKVFMSIKSFYILSFYIHRIKCICWYFMCEITIIWLWHLNLLTTLHCNMSLPALHI